uniref:Uncharacterized protein n=1 Tax=Cacopsylla melanoneura TaxID=428564 RepID=A0A8D9AFS8_9HEMI
MVGDATRRTTTPKRKKCSQCSKLSEFLSCFKCDEPICYPCADVSSSEATLFRKPDKNIKFECNSCCNSVSTGQNSNKTLTDLLNLVMVLQTQVKELLEANKMKVQENQPSEEFKDTDAIINEMNERERRAKNVLIFDIQETNSTELQDKILHDKQKVNSILESLQLPNLGTNSRIRRLGKHSENPRPILITVENKFNAISILRKAREANKKNIKKDMTPMQRDRMKSLQEKLKKKIDDGETNWTIRYIKGSPQLWKITDNHDQTQRKK